MDPIADEDGTDGSRMEWAPNAVESEMLNGGAREKETGSQTKMINPKMGMPGDSRIKFKFKPTKRAHL